MSNDRRLVAGALTAFLTSGLLAACGGGGGGGGGPGGVSQYTIGGSVSGLAGSGLVLQNTGSTPLTVTANGSFTFSGSIPSGSSYAVTVSTQPKSPSQTCTVVNGSGTVTSANIANVAVNCVTTSYSIGGTVSGLVGSGLVLMNGGSALSISANGGFSFSGATPSGTAYSITVGSQPTGPTEMCAVVNSTGTVGSANVNDIAVKCRVSVARFAYVSSHSGVFCYSIDAGTQALAPVGASPCASGILSGFGTEPRGKFGYATSAANQLIPYSIDQTSGALTQITGADVATGTNPLDVHVDSSGRFAYVANYGSDNISGYSIDQTTGSLIAVPGSPFAAGHLPNRLAIDVAGQFLYVANNGLISGAAKGVSGFVIDSSTGALTSISTSPYDTPAPAIDVAVDPATKFVFATSPSANQVSVFAINSTTGGLTAAPGSPFSTGTFPVGVTVDLTGSFLYVANESDNTISGYAIDSTTGALHQLASSPFQCAGGPYFLNVSPNGGVLIVSNNGNGTVGTYSIDSQTGALTQVSGSPVSAGGGSAYAIAFAP